MEKVFLFDSDTCATARVFMPLRPRVLGDVTQLEAAFAGSPDALWIAVHSRALLRALAEVRPGVRATGRLLVLDHYKEGDFFRSHFERVVVARNGFLSPDELLEVLAAPNASDLFIGGQVDAEAGVLLLFRGDLGSLVVPLGNFEPTASGPRPDPSRFEIIDHGQTIKLGAYEASAEAVLYEVDPEYRRRIKARRRAEERGFGASLRRLRIQRGLRQSDFPGISEKEIGRIERGEVEELRSDTRKRLAERLGVRAEEIEEY